MSFLRFHVKGFVIADSDYYALVSGNVNTFVLIKNTKSIGFSYRSLLACAA
jgi:hypothetical protein